MSGFLRRVGGACAAHPWRVTATWVVALVVALGLVSLSGGTPQDNYDTPGLPSQPTSPTSRTQSSPPTAPPRSSSPSRRSARATRGRPRWSATCARTCCRPASRSPAGPPRSPTSPRTWPGESGWCWSRRRWPSSAAPTGGSPAGWTAFSPTSTYTAAKPPCRPRRPFPSPHHATRHPPKNRHPSPGNANEVGSRVSGLPTLVPPSETQPRCQPRQTSSPVVQTELGPRREGAQRRQAK